MSFSDHKITAFTHRIADLPDQPNLPADELKARFDSSPEELRQSVNGICDDADRLESRVSGIIAETLSDTITEDMLSDELAAGVAWKSDLYYGTYTGDGVYPREIELGFAPKVVLIMQTNGQTGSPGYSVNYLAVPVEQPSNEDYCLLTQTGFKLRNVGGQRSHLNYNGRKFTFLALK